MYNITELQANSKLQTVSQSECAKSTSLKSNGFVKSEVNQMPNQWLKWSCEAGGGSQVGANPIPIPHPTNLALFGHKITLYRFNHGGSNRIREAEPPDPITLTTVANNTKYTAHKILAYHTCYDYQQKKKKHNYLHFSKRFSFNISLPHRRRQRPGGEQQNSADTQRPEKRTYRIRHTERNVASTHGDVLRYSIAHDEHLSPSA